MEKLNAFRKACDRVAEFVEESDVEYPRSMSEACVVQFNNINNGLESDIILTYDVDKGGYKLRYDRYEEVTGSLHINNLSDINGEVINRLFRKVDE